MRLSSTSMRSSQAPSEAAAHDSAPKIEGGIQRSIQVPVCRAKRRHHILQMQLMTVNRRLCLSGDPSFLETPRPIPTRPELPALDPSRSQTTLFHVIFPLGVCHLGVFRKDARSLLQDGISSAVVLTCLACSDSLATRSLSDPDRQPEDHGR